MLAVGLLALWPATALGFLAGRLIPLRVVAPIAGLVTYLGLAAPMYGNGSPLTPVFGFVSETEAWSLGFHAWQAAWLLTITAALLLIAERRWIGAAMPAVALIALYAVAPSDRPDVDRGAAALVCTTTGPQICVTRVNAFLLNDVARIGQSILTKVAGIPGAPTRAIDRSAGAEPGPDAVALELTGQAKIDGTLFHPRYLQSDFGQMVYPTDCPSTDDDRVYRTQRLADTWLTGDAPVWDEPIGQLRALPPERQRTWVRGLPRRHSPLRHRRADVAYALLRNTLGCVGLVAGAAVVLGARFAWAPAFTYVCAVYAAGPRRDGSPREAWAWPVEPSSAPAEWTVALIVALAGSAAYILAGPKEHHHVRDTP